MKKHDMIRAKKGGGLEGRGFHGEEGAAASLGGSGVGRDFAHSFFALFSGHPLASDVAFTLFF